MASANRAISTSTCCSYGIHACTATAAPRVVCYGCSGQSCSCSTQDHTTTAAAWASPCLCCTQHTLLQVHRIGLMPANADPAAVRRALPLLQGGTALYLGRAQRPLPQAQQTGLVAPTDAIHAAQRSGAAPSLGCSRWVLRTSPSARSTAVRAGACYCCSCGSQARTATAAAWGCSRSVLHTADSPKGAGACTAAARCSSCSNSSTAFWRGFSSALPL